MSENTKIEWTDSTFNPWEGCTKVGPGCDHCYAENRNARFAGGQSINWGPGAPRRRTSAKNWNLPRAWDREADAFLAQHGRRRRVFCASLADVFDNAVDPAWRADLFRLIADTPNLDWLLLTKRIGNAAEMIEAAVDSNDLPCWPWRHVWLGATVVNQAEADRDIPKLLATPAAVRFLSIEPMLGPIDLERPRPGPDLDQGGGRMICQPWLIQSGIDWVIVGGESGPGARPLHPDWARDLRRQCESAGVPFLFKQWGEHSTHHVERGGAIEPPCAVTIDGLLLWNCDESAWQAPELTTTASDVFADGNVFALKVGKKAAGRLLDGVELNGYPCFSASSSTGRRP